MSRPGAGYGGGLWRIASPSLAVAEVGLARRAAAGAIDGAAVVLLAVGPAVVP